MSLFDEKNVDTTVDRIAQAVIDRIEERSELNRMVEMVAQRVMELQRQERELISAESEAHETNTQEDGDNE